MSLSVMIFFTVIYQIHSVVLSDLNKNSSSYSRILMKPPAVSIIIYLYVCVQENPEHSMQSLIKLIKRFTTNLVFLNRDDAGSQEILNT